MLSRTLAVFAAAVAGLMLSIGVASAADYVPFSVPSAGGGSGAAAAAPGPVASLSYTGAGFSVGGAVLIAAAVLVLGIALLVIGARMSRRRSTGS